MYQEKTLSLSPTSIKRLIYMTQDTDKRIVILGGGDYPHHSIPLRLIENAERIVCCDGSAFDLIRHGYTPWRIVGDCDSILSPKDEEEEMMLAQHRNCIRRFSGQNDNDQTKAVRYCLDHGITHIDIVGATGKREDHTLGNISLLAEYLTMGADIRMYTDYGTFVACKGKASFDVDIPKNYTVENDSIPTRQKSIQVSIFNVSAHNLHAEGLRYQLSNFCQWWQGTLNEAISSPFLVEGDGLYIVYICYE